jgi:hypothetical protein
VIRGKTNRLFVTSELNRYFCKQSSNCPGDCDSLSSLLGSSFFVYHCLMEETGSVSFIKWTKCYPTVANSYRRFGTNYRSHLQG